MKKCSYCKKNVSCAKWYYNIKGCSKCYYQFRSAKIKIIKNENKMLGVTMHERK